MRQLIKRGIAKCSLCLYKLPTIRKKKHLPERESVIDYLNTVWQNHPIYSHDTFQNKPYDVRVDVCIIIPFYNAEKEYLEKCMDSLLNQKTQYLYKIICINDGSKGDTLSNLEYYKKKNPDKVIVWHQNNQGISCARNQGIKLANSDYIGFVDQDDWVSDQYVEMLVKRAKDTNADVVKCSHAVVRNGKTCSEYLIPDISLEMGIGDAITEYSGMIWSGIYKRELFDLVRFPENYWYEDMISRILLYRIGGRFESMHEILYYKRKHRNNASTVLWNGRKKQCIDHIYLLEHLMNESRRMKLSENNLKKTVLHELGQYLMWRTKEQDIKTKKMLFYYACYLFKELPSDNDDQLSWIEQEYSKCFSYADYGKWLLLSWNDWAVTE